MERYALSPRLSFQHVFLSEDRRGGAAEQEALQLLNVLRSQDPNTLAADLGDPLPLPQGFDAATLEEVRRTFGDEFADGLRDLPTGSWQGPVASAFGQHLIYVTEHQPGRRPELAEVRETVRRDWLAERQREARETFYDSMRERYRVTIEGRDTLAAGTPSPDRDAT